MADVGIRIHADGAQQASQELGHVAGAINSIGASAAAHFSAAAIGYMLVRLGKATYDFAANIGDLRAKFKVNGETLQAWGYAADKTGGQLSDVTTAYKALGKAIGKAEGGNTNILEMFQGLGVTDLSNQEQVFNQLATRIGEGGLSMKQLLDLTVLMGRNVNSLFPMFEEGFADLQQQFKDLGLGIKDGVTDKIKEADDTFVQMWYRLRATAAPAVAVISQALTHVLNGVGLIMATGGGLLSGGLEGGVKGAQDYMEQFTKASNQAKIAAGKATGKGPKPNADDPLQAALNAQAARQPSETRAIARSVDRFGGAQQVDALSRMGVSVGGLDTTAFRGDLARLDRKLGDLVKHVAKISAAAEADYSVTEVGI